jgi:hypothetical protein
MKLRRRTILQGLLGTALGAMLPRPASAMNVAKRFIVLYFPDGIPAPGGQPSAFQPSGMSMNFSLPANLMPLAPYKNKCAFFRNLSMGPTDAGSHPGGAKKLLTAVDGGNGESIDRRLARTVGSNAPFKHIYLGAAATANNASGDKFISYPSPGTTVPPEDDPKQAFSKLFGQSVMPMQGGIDPKSVVDTVLGDLGDLEAALGNEEKQKLDLHMDAMRDVEKRIGSAPSGASCTMTPQSVATLNSSMLLDPSIFPDVLRAQMDVMVQAMACGLTQVGVIQASQHTSELIMSRFPNTPFYTPNYDMRSHQASHYGTTADSKYSAYVLQRTWFVEQLAYLVKALDALPEGQGTMLDNSIVLLCSEVAEGNTHSHDDMPFVIAGKGGGTIQTGALFDYGYRRHADLLLSIAHAMGDSTSSFGDASSGTLSGLLI